MKQVLGDLQIVVERHSDVIRHGAVVFNVLIGLRVLGFVLSAFSVFYSFFSLNPVQLFSIEIWRLATCLFVGKNVIIFIWSLFSLHFGVNLVKQANSTENLLKIFIGTHVLSTIVVSIVGIISFVFTRSVFLLYDAPVVDMVAINAAVLVLIKQFLPDSIVLTTPIGRVKYTHLPFCALVFSIVGSFLRLFYPVVIIQVLAGIQVSWTYLRFFNPHETDAIYGDSNEHFTWASLFPRHLQPLCTVVGRICFRSLVKLGVCKRQVRHVDLDSLQTVAINLPGLESSARDADRRRKKALQELNARLKNSKRVDTIAWDEEEDEPNMETAVNTSVNNESEALPSDQQPPQDDKQPSVA